MLLHLLVYWLATMSLKVSGTHASDFFSMRLNERLSCFPTRPTVPHRLCADCLNGRLSGLVPFFAVHLGSGAKVCCGCFKSTEAVCMLEARGVKPCEVAFRFVHCCNTIAQVYRFVKRFFTLSFASCRPRHRKSNPMRESWLLRDHPCQSCGCRTQNRLRGLVRFLHLLVLCRS